MKKLSKMLSVVLSLAMCASMAMPALAVTYDIDNGNVSIERGEDGTVISWQNSRENASTDNQITITQSSQSSTNTVHVGENVKADITLKDVSLTGGTSFGDGDTKGKGATIAIEKGSDVTIELDGENTLTASNGKAGLYVAQGASVTIKDDNGDGSLVATGSAVGTTSGAGIGGNGKSDAGSITISGGDVTATGGSGAAGIGSSRNGSVEQIEVSGGDVTAIGGANGGAGIGTGLGGTANQIEISGGNVTANGGNEGSGIGAGQGKNAAVDQIKVSGGEVTATGGSNAAGIGTGSQGTASQIEISGGNVTANGGSSGAGIGSGNKGTVDQIKVSGGDVTANGGAQGAGIGTGYTYSDGTVSEIEISGGKVTATGGLYGAGIGTGTGFAGLGYNKVGSINISGGDVTANGGGYAAGIGSGRAGTTTQINVSGGNVTANGGTYAAAIGAGYEGIFGAVSISGGDIVAQSGSKASAIGNGTNGKGGTIAIQGVNNLIALGDVYFAIDTRSNTTGVDQAVLNGRFLTDANGLSKANEVEFVIVDAEGKEVKRFTLKPQDGNNMYESFAVNLPEGGTYYVFCEGDYDNSIAGYESGGKQVAYVIEENDMLNADLMQFPSFDVSYSFISGTEGQELPESLPAAPSNESGKKMTLNQLNELAADTQAYDDVEVEGGVWHFDGWSMSQPVINEEGVLTDAELVGTWSFTADPVIDEPDVPLGNEPTVEIEDEDVPLAGIFTRADAIGYLWEQSGSPEWDLSDFEDVPEDHYWAVAIGWAQDMGIALPDEDGNFRPDDLVLRSVESLEISPEGELQEFLNRYAVHAGIELDEGELFIELEGSWDDVIMGEEAQVIFDEFFAKLELALAQAA